MYKQSVILEALMKVLPYSEQITQLDLESGESVIYFTWIGTRFKIAFGSSIYVSEVEGSFLSGSNLSILLQSILIQKACSIDYERNLNEKAK